MTLLRFHRLQWLFGALVIVVYTAVSFRVGAVFPFYDFPMFSRMTESRGRAFARTPDGAVETVDTFDAWYCPDLERALLMDSPCGLPQTWYFDELLGVGNVLVYLRSNSSDHAVGEPVEVIFRAWLSQDDEVDSAPVDCPIMQCNARRRPGKSAP
ncbi:MAG: hypothetical protein R3F39_14290 [Myxococcota bacterium]